MRAPLDLGRLEQLARPRERPQEVGRASRLVPHPFPHERLHVGVVRRQRDDVAEIRREPAALGRATGPFDRGADRGLGPTMLTGARLTTALAPRTAPRRTLAASGP